jgi:hypothetical protein
MKLEEERFVIKKSEGMLLYIHRRLESRSVKEECKA